MRVRQTLAMLLWIAACGEAGAQSNACPWKLDAFQIEAERYAAKSLSLFEVSRTLDREIETTSNAVITASSLDPCDEPMTEAAARQQTAAHEHLSEMEELYRVTPSLLDCGPDLIARIEAAMEQAVAERQTTRAVRLESMRDLVITIEEKAFEASVGIYQLVSKARRLAGQADRNVTLCSGDDLDF